MHDWQITRCSSVWPRDTYQTSVVQRQNFAFSRGQVVDPAIRERDRWQKAKMKKYAHEKRRATPYDIKRGDRVLLKQERKNKLSTRHDPDPYAVVGTKGTSLLLKRRAEPEIMRNSSAVRKLPQGDNNEMGKQPREADGGPDHVVETREPSSQRLRKTS